jgi:RNA recognition motif-containing protein
LVGIFFFILLPNPQFLLLLTLLGEIENARLLTDKHTGAPKGVAFIDFKLPVSAASAIDAMNNQMYGDKPLKVSYAMNTNPGKHKTSSAPSASFLSNYGAMVGYPPFTGFAVPDPYGQRPPMGYGGKQQYY